MSFTVKPNSTTITTIDEGSAFCYVSNFDDNNEISGENIFTNTLNVLGYIPVISIISGLARIVFAEYMLRNLRPDNHVAIKHYESHKFRGLALEVFGSTIFGLGNVTCMWWDIKNAFSSFKNKNIEAPISNAAEIPKNLYLL